MAAGRVVTALLLILVSTALQAVAAWLAFRHALATRAGSAYLLAVALALMAGRRGVSLLASLTQGRPLHTDAELVALVISGLLVVSLFYAARGAPALSLDSSSARRESSRLATLSAALAGLATLGAAAVGLSAYTSSRETAERTVLQTGRLVTQLLGQGVSLTPREPGLHVLLERWQRTPKRYPGSELCVIAPDGTLLLHTGRPQAVGSDVRGVRLGEGLTLGDLLRDRRDWVGEMQRDDQRQVTAFTYAPLLGAHLGHHIPAEVLDQEVRAASLPWAAGLAVVTLLLLPVGMALMHRAYLTSQEQLALARQELRQREARSRQARKLEALGQLAGGVAHDFNNLLTVINGYAELLLASGPSAEVQAIAEAGKRGAALTSQLLAFGRRAVLRPEVLDMGQALGEVERLLARLLEEGVRLRLEVQPDLPRVLLDPGQLQQLALNLAVNARDAMPEGGELTLSLHHVEVAGDLADEAGISPGRYVRLAVTDTGVGMTPETRARIFEPFFTTKPQGRGTGLGLSTVHGIAKQNGLGLRVLSTPGAGTTFEVYFPPAPPSAESTQPAAGSTERASPMAPRGVVLLVEDDPLVREVLCSVLAGAGHQVIEAAGLTEARARLESGPRPDVLVSDVVLSDGTGPQLVAALRAEGRCSPVVYCTGYSPEQIPLEPGDVVLTKPFLPQRLLDAVQGGLAAASGRTPAPAQAAAPLVRVTPALRAALEVDLEELDRLIGRQDLEAATQAAHRLRGSASVLGATGVAQEAEALERAAAARDPLAARRHVDALADRIAALIGDVKA